MVIRGLEGSLIDQSPEVYENKQFGKMNFGVMYLLNYGNSQAR